MNEDEVGKLLGDVVPAAPSTKGWARKASGRVRRRRLLAGVAAGVVALAVPVGLLLSQGGNGPLQATPQPADSSPIDPTATPTGPIELTGQVMVYQYADEELPHLCLGMVMESYPPQCSGPTLRGDFSWDEVEHEEAGTRWTNESYTVFGHYDVDDGANGSFTLTRPLQPAVPPTVGPEPVDFPQLCSDMLVDADPSRAGIDDQNALSAKLAELPVVGTWVSDGSDAFNVLVRGDAAAAFADLRTVWGGELCVESSEAPTEAERQAAVERIMAALPQGQVLSASGGTGIEPVVELQVVVADPATESSIREAAGPGLEVRVAAVLAPAEEPTPQVTQSPSTSEDPGEETGDELVGTVSVYQRPGDDAPRVYLCGVPPFNARSRAPDLLAVSCDGPTIKGEFSWEDVVMHAGSPSAEGEVWTIGGHRIRGYYDPEDGPSGSFTLSGPVLHVATEPDELADEDVTTAPTGTELQTAIDEIKAALEPGGELVRFDLVVEDGQWVLEAQLVAPDADAAAAVNAAAPEGVRVRVSTFFEPAPN